MTRTTRKQRPQKRANETCPKCGYCDKCGRSNAAPVWPWPVTPHVPYVPYTPPLKPWYGPVQMPGLTSTASPPLNGSDGLKVTYDDVTIRLGPNKYLYGDKAGN